MTDENDSGSIELTRRRALAGLATIGAASATAGAGTAALMSDSGSSDNNTVRAGEMTLTLGANVSKTVDIDDLMPGEGGKEVFAVTNDGDADGVLGLGVSNVRNDPSNAPSSNVRTFESQVTGYFDYGTHDNEVLLSEFGVDNAVTEIDLSGSGLAVTVDLPAPLGSASNGDNFALAFDSNNDGTADFQVTGSAGSSGLQYKEFDGTWGSSQAVSSTPGVTQSNPEPGKYVIGIGSSRISSSSAFGFGGQVVYQGLDTVNGQGPSDGINDRVLLTPGFGFGPGFNGDAGRYTTIDPSNERTLDDVLDLELRLDDDVDSPELDEDDDGDLFVQGKPDRIEGETGGPYDLGQNQTKRVEVIYRLPKNAGSIVENERTRFDLDLTLTQAQPTPE
jgi:predicted ribosomally synthesized peptide with SipW-like signal peptide